MEKVDVNLIDEFAFGKIDREKFLQRTDVKLNFSELVELSLCCKISANYRRFEVLLWHFPKQISPNEKEIFYRLLLLETWHQEHEEVISAFQHTFTHSKENVSFIKWAITNIPDYLLNKDVRRSYIKKCMYAIAAQPQPEANLALQELQESEDEIISKLASDQLARLVG